jgi:hypothetical protein
MQKIGDFMEGELVRIEGLQSAQEHNGKLGRVLPMPAAEGTDAPERIAVQLVDGARPKLRVRPANLHRAYEPIPFREVCVGDSSKALTWVLEQSGPGSMACVHYARQSKTPFGAPQVFRGAFDYTLGKGCEAMDKATLAKATSEHTSLHIKISAVADALEIVLISELDEKSGDQTWYDIGLPREVWKVPLGMETRNKALDGSSDESKAFQETVATYFGNPGPGEERPSYLAFNQAMAVVVSGCRCPGGHKRAGKEL